MPFIPFRFASLTRSNTGMPGSEQNGRGVGGSPAEGGRRETRAAKSSSEHNSIAFPNPKSLPPMDISTKSMERRMLARVVVRAATTWSIWEGSGGSAGSMPAYVPSIASEIEAPEQANDRNVTDVWGSLFSISIAASACAEAADRWHRRSIHVGEAATLNPPNPLGSGLSRCTTSGLPSPEAKESPSDTMSQSLTTTLRVTDALPFLP